jgi:glycosyltransferase involved in cell wall biosynthesis
VFPEGDIESFTSALVDIIENDKKRNDLQASGYRYVTNHLTHAAQAKKLANYINEILG